MNKRIEPELFSNVPDLNQVENTTQSAPQTSNTTSAPEQDTLQSAAPKQSNITTWISFAAILGLAAGGYFLHQQNLKTQAQLVASEQRIAELESALSATGEEMGESAGAIKAKLSALSKRTDELWSQMDKLWASAWRRNQSEIKKLEELTASNQSKQTKAVGDASAKISALSQAQSELTLKLSYLEEQQQAANTLKTKLATLNSKLDELKAQSQGRDAKQVEIGGTIAQLELTQTALTEQLSRLEKKLTTGGQTL
ncbi:hypothetical protein [Pseudoalteromonas sp. G4]|uniref:hypothetical protein n=1 Tax=Pseudoalteromonas sp. G4 TaxID=2992761 RepID=UPI00237E174F|nr:hypothetical protein [Pseudoalteromonas sp. G4]MDE3273946.1 hypothetical protein [Pseudoalteromonas sp. G4]